MKWLALIFLVTFPQIVLAGFTAKELAEVSRANELLFEGYVGGISEALVVSGTVCMGKNVVTFNDVTRLIKSSLRRAQMQELNGDAIYFVIGSLIARYPCSK